MNPKASAARCSCRLFFSIVISVAFAFLFTGAHPLPALADGGVSFVGTTSSTSEKSYSTILGCYRITLEFDKNVGYADVGRDAAFIENNIEKVRVLDAQGKEIEEDYVVHAGSSREERQLLYVDITEYLTPLTTYTVYIDEGIQAANGVDVSTESYEITFRTSAQCSNGLSLYQNILILTCVILIACGMAAGIVRTRKERR